MRRSGRSASLLLILIVLSEADICASEFALSDHLLDLFFREREVIVRLDFDVPNLSVVHSLHRDLK